MKQILLLAALALAAGACSTNDGPPVSDGAQTSTEPAPAIESGRYELDPAHSRVGFRVKHLGISNVDGTFGDVVGTITSGGDLASLQTEVTIQAASIDTQNGQRDDHLRSPDFFDAAQHPTLAFTSTGVEPLGGSRFRMTGDLTMHGVTKPVTLEGEYAGSAPDGQGNRKIAFTAEGNINRSEWGLTWNKPIETGGVVVSDEVRLVLEVEAGAPIQTAGATES